MAKLVIDASLAAAWCFPEEHTEYTNGVLQMLGGSVDPIAPTLWAYEVRNALLMGLKRGRITQEDADELLRFLGALGVQLSAPRSYDEIFAVAETHSLTVYDAAYLELAVRENLPLASLDSALRRAAVRVDVALFELPRMD